MDGFWLILEPVIAPRLKHFCAPLHVMGQGIRIHSRCVVAVHLVETFLDWVNAASPQLCISKF